MTLMYFNIRFKHSQQKAAELRKKLQSKPEFKKKVDLIRDLQTELKFQEKLKEDCL